MYSSIVWDGDRAEGQRACCEHLYGSSGETQYGICDWVPYLSLHSTSHGRPTSTINNHCFAPRHRSIGSHPLHACARNRTLLIVFFFPPQCPEIAYRRYCLIAHDPATAIANANANPTAHFFSTRAFAASSLPSSSPALLGCSAAALILTLHSSTLPLSHSPPPKPASFHPRLRVSQRSPPAARSAPCSAPSCLPSSVHLPALVRQEDCAIIMRHAGFISSATCPSSLPVADTILLSTLGAPTTTCPP